MYSVLPSRPIGSIEQNRSLFSPWPSSRSSLSFSRFSQSPPQKCRTSIPAMPRPTLPHRTGGCSLPRPCAAYGLAYSCRPPSPSTASWARRRRRARDGGACFVHRRWGHGGSGTALLRRDGWNCRSKEPLPRGILVQDFYFSSAT